MQLDWPALARDVALATRLDWGVRDQRAGIWLYRTSGFEYQSFDPEFRAEGWLVATQPHSKLLLGEAVHDPRCGFVAVAEVLQDIVIDEIHHGWPEIKPSGVRYVVAEPGVTVQGEIGWLVEGSLLCRFGELSKLLPIK